jgi:hypothetical protein
LDELARFGGQFAVRVTAAAQTPTVGDVDDAEPVVFVPVRIQAGVGRDRLP